MWGVCCVTDVSQCGTRLCVAVHVCAGHDLSRAVRSVYCSAGVDDAARVRVRV
jgi:hypothetical protein